VDGRLVVDLWWERDERDPQPLRADTLALLGAFVEASTPMFADAGQMASSSTTSRPGCSTGIASSRPTGTS
jgi:hypothetical protein